MKAKQNILFSYACGLFFLFSSFPLMAEDDLTQNGRELFLKFVELKPRFNKSFEANDQLELQSVLYELENAGFDYIESIFNLIVEKNGEKLLRKSQARVTILR